MGTASALIVTFTAPASNGGSTITGYTATSTPGSLTGTVSGAAAAPITVSGLTSGTSYTFTVHATNAIGNSSESSASNAFTAAVVYDTFDRADASALGSAQTGQAWALVSDTGTATGRIASNTAYITNTISNAASTAYVSAGKADVDYSITIAALGAQLGYSGAALRVQNAANMLALYINGAGSGATNYGLQKTIAGVNTQLGPIAATPTVGDVIRVVIVGVTVDVYINATHYGPYTATGLNTTSQNVGFLMDQIGGAAPTVRFDNIKVY